MQNNKVEEIKIGNQYKSRETDSSGITYEVIGFKNDGKTINFKGVDCKCFATWSREQIEKWISEGRLKLVRKNLFTEIFSNAERFIKKK